MPLSHRNLSFAKTSSALICVQPMTLTGSGANLIIMDDPRHDPTLFREARTLQWPSFQPSSYHSGRAMVYHLQAELSQWVRSDGGERCHGRTYHRFAMGPMLRSRLRENVEEICAPCRLIKVLEQPD